MTEPACPYFLDGEHLGYCNDCGEEAELGTTCCDGGEVVPYEDDPCEL